MRPRIGVLVVQLGTPDEPTAPALRRYLREFLSDRRVIDLPRALWWPILHLGVLRTRPARSAALYARIWTNEGSPLLQTTREQARALSEALAADGADVRVDVAMRYGSPSIQRALAALRDDVDRLLVVPLYPQYAGATTGSTLDSLLGEVRTWRVVPSLRTMPPYFGEPAYLDAVAAVARESLGRLSWRPDRLVISFHGLPRRYADAGDPYPDQCARTADCLRQRLGRAPDEVAMTFQSRFGREEWLRPYTDATLLDLARQGATVAVMCPGFAADCLETLEEIDITNREAFERAGGRRFHYIPCVNTHPAWISALRALVQGELHGWI